MKEYSTTQRLNMDGKRRAWFLRGAVTLWGSKVNLWFLLGLLLLTAAKLFLVRGLSLAIRPHTIDDLLFIQLAQSIAQGQWLGPFNVLTLFKLPGYPLWLATNYYAGWHLLTTHQIFYVIACATTVVALRGLIRHDLALFILYAVLLFSPQSFDSDSLGVQRENLYAPLGLFVFACVAGVTATCKKSKRRLASWAFGLGCCMSLFWITREESPLIVPSIALAFGYVGYKLWRSRARDNFARLLILVVPIIMVAATVCAVCAMNYRCYDFFGMSDMKSEAFRKAYGALLQLGNADAAPPMLFSAATQERLYAASPAFAELRPYFKKCNETVKSYLGTDPNIDEDEFTGYWLPLFLLRSVSDAGYYSSPDAAAAYYERLAAELNTAYEKGLLECRPTKTSLWAPWRPEYATRLPVQFLLSAGRLSSLYGCEIEFVSKSWGSPEVQRMFEEMTGEKAGVLAPVETSANGKPLERRIQIRWEQMVLTSMKTLYRILTPPLAACAVLCLFLSLGIHAKRRNFSPLTIVSLALFLAISARLTVFSYMHISMGNGSETWRYYVPLFPLLVFFTFVSIAGCISLFFQKPRNDTQ